MEKKIAKIDQKTMAILIVVLGVIMAGFIIYFKQVPFKGSFSPTLTSEKAGEKVLKYLNDNFLEQGGSQVSLLSSEPQGRFLYKLSLNFEGEIFEVYTTRDGRFFSYKEANFDTDAPFSPPSIGQ